MTFTDAETKGRLQDLAKKWGWVMKYTGNPNTSRVVEFLLMQVLEKAEAGKLKPAEDEEQ